MAEASLAERLRYAFDNSMSKGTIALIAWLSVASFGFLSLCAAALWLGGLAPEGAEPMGPVEAAWFGLMRMLDAGTMGGDTGGWPVLLVELAITMGGVFLVSILIGVLTSGIEAKIEELRKGRSKVIESGHTVILGWSSHLYTLLPELIEANANRKGACIVILADRDKVEMEDELRDRVPNRRTTRVVCRTGAPIELGDLDLVSVQTSKSIVVLSPEGSDDADTDVIKTVLALTNGPGRRKEPYHIVAEIHDPANLEAAKLVGRDECEWVLAGDLISRITVQTCRQSGLSIVITELLDFGGDEVYFATEPALTGKTFGEALHLYETSSLLGIRTAAGQTRVNPPMDTRIESGDQIIAISEDDDTIRLATAPAPIDSAAIRQAPPSMAKPERTLLIGWNWKAPRIVGGLDGYVASGSLVTVLAEAEDASDELDRLCPDLKNVTLSVIQGDTTNRRTLEGLDLPSFDHIILLCSDELEPQRADARVLVTLLHLRDIGERGKHNFSIVSEMLDVRNRALAEVTKADDFIVSDRLVSLMMSQISENKHLAPVFEDLFDADGSEIYVKPATEYVATGAAVTFATVVEAARRRGEIAIGYRIAANARDAGGGYGVSVNPAKSTRVTFGADDRVIVVAES